MQFFHVLKLERPTKMKGKCPNFKLRHIRICLINLVVKLIGLKNRFQKTNITFLPWSVGQLSNNCYLLPSFRNHQLALFVCSCFDIIRMNSTNRYANFFLLDFSSNECKSKITAK